MDSAKPTHSSLLATHKKLFHSAVLPFATMYLMYTLDENGKRVYTLKVRVCGERE
jgi:hypothetical protein